MVTVSKTVKRELDASSQRITAFFAPQAKVIRDISTASVSAARKSAPLTSSSFDKNKWVESLTPSQKELLEVEISTLDESWLAVLHTELTKDYFLSLKKFVNGEIASGKKVFPPVNDIYSWSRLTPLNSVKVVILGQDPYHNFNQAHGLAFSVNPPTRPPPSLVNIYKGVAACYPDFKIPQSGLLTPWASRGVLLLNACLTVQCHNANSHAGKGWEKFTEQVLLAALAAKPSGICFLAWGNPASKRIDQIKPAHHVLRCVHPSPLSASRGFFTAHHFRKANDWLRDTYGPGSVIDWALDPQNKIADIQELLAAGSADATTEKDIESGEKSEDKEATVTETKVEETEVKETQVLKTSSVTTTEDKSLATLVTEDDDAELDKLLE